MTSMFVYVTSVTCYIAFVITIATDKVRFSTKKYQYFSYFSTKTYDVALRGASNEYPQHMFSWRNKKNNMWILSRIWSYTSLCV